MKTAYKYPVPRRSPKFSLHLPKDFKFLRIHFQGEDLQFWAEVVPEKVSDQVDFQVFGTGHEIPDHAKYLQTFDDGPFVFHLYQLS
jgi:hypothetical protein